MSSVRIPCFKRAGRLAGLLASSFVFALAACAAAPRPAPCYHSPWLDRHTCETPVISKVPYATLKQTLTAYFEQKKQDGVLIEAGMYFRDLEDGPHFGVNEHANFAAASLLKLPIVIQYLSLAEEDAALLKLRLVVPPHSGRLYDVMTYPPVEKLVTGEAYTIEDLLRRTMEYSDNLAFAILRQHLIDRYGSDSVILESYRQIGLVPAVADGNYVISVARYSSLFKLIYRASFLGPEMSEKLVEMMLESPLDRTLEQGVPAGVKVAHKFGQMGFNHERHGVQLHDCGIVYYPDNPYTLCVMTRGRDYAELEKVIAEVSRRVYAEVDARRGRRH